MDYAGSNIEKSARSLVPGRGVEIFRYVKHKENVDAGYSDLYRFICSDASIVKNSFAGIDLVPAQKDGVPFYAQKVFSMGKSGLRVLQIAYNDNMNLSRGERIRYTLLIPVDNLIEYQTVMPFGSTLIKKVELDREQDVDIQTRQLRPLILNADDPRACDWKGGLDALEHAFAGNQCALSYFLSRVCEQALSGTNDRFAVCLANEADATDKAFSIMQCVSASLPASVAGLISYAACVGEADMGARQVSFFTGQDCSTWRELGFDVLDITTPNSVTAPDTSSNYCRRLASLLVERNVEEICRLRDAMQGDWPKTNSVYSVDEQYAMHGNDADAVLAVPASLKERSKSGSLCDGLKAQIRLYVLGISNCGSEHAKNECKTELFNYIRDEYFSKSGTVAELKNALLECVNNQDAAKILLAEAVLNSQVLMPIGDTDTRDCVGSTLLALNADRYQKWADIQLRGSNPFGEGYADAVRYYAKRISSADISDMVTHAIASKRFRLSIAGAVCLRDVLHEVDASARTICTLDALVIESLKNTSEIQAEESEYALNYLENMPGIEANGLYLLYLLSGNAGQITADVAADLPKRWRDFLLNDRDAPFEQRINSALDNAYKAHCLSKQNGELKKKEGAETECIDLQLALGILRYTSPADGLEPRFDRSELKKSVCAVSSKRWKRFVEYARTELEHRSANDENGASKLESEDLRLYYAPRSAGKAGKNEVGNSVTLALCAILAGSMGVVLLAMAIQSFLQ